MSKGKAWAIDRHIKAVLRLLDYVENKQALRELVEWAKPRREKHTLSVAERIRFRYWLWWKYGPECAYCHRVFDWRYGLTIDHIQPKSKGGAVRDIQNMALACHLCNEAKGNKWEG